MRIDERRIEKISAILNATISYLKVCVTQKLRGEIETIKNRNNRRIFFVKSYSLDAYECEKQVFCGSKESGKILRTKVHRLQFGYKILKRSSYAKHIL